MTQTILVVADKKELLTMVKLYLTQEGFRVVTAMDGQEALYVARYERPDLILLDLMMPPMGGYEFMRAHAREAETPIVILTARLEENDKVLGLELGADDYVTKPFSMRELTARIGAVLRRSEAGTPGSGDAVGTDAVHHGREILARTTDERPPQCAPSPPDGGSGAPSPGCLPRLSCSADRSGSAGRAWRRSPGSRAR